VYSGRLNHHRDHRSTTVTTNRKTIKQTSRYARSSR
jgi:hypothetical protein